MNDPVTGNGGPVGIVSTLGPNYSIVTLLTDHSYAVTAQVLNNAGDTGVLKPAVGNPYQLLLEDMPQHATVAVGDLVVTAGFKSSHLASLYPKGIPIGTISDQNWQDDLLNNTHVQVSPIADLRHLDVVQILTNPNPGTQRASVSTG
jgi:cell shape-determining protein MreC